MLAYRTWPFGREKSGYCIRFFSCVIAGCEGFKLRDVAKFVQNSGGKINAVSYSEERSE